MAKQIYIDENGVEHLVSGTINNAQMLPVDATDNTSTKDYINNGLNSKQNSINGTYTTNGLSPLANVSIADGGYCKIGNLVVVNLRLVPSANISAGNTLISGLPKPQMMNNLNKVGVANNQNANLTVDANGGLFCATALSSGGSLILSVTYLADTI